MVSRVIGFTDRLNGDDCSDCLRTTNKRLRPTVPKGPFPAGSIDCLNEQRNAKGCDKHKPRFLKHPIPVSFQTIKREIRNELFTGNELTKHYV